MSSAKQPLALHQNISGFTLLECIIAICLAGILLTGLIRFVAHQASLTQQIKTLSTQQESIRHAHQLFHDVIEYSGNLGCPQLESAQLFSALNHDHFVNQRLINQQPIYQLEHKLWSWFIEPDSALAVTAHPHQTAPIKVSGYISLKKGDLAVVSNCDYASIFMVSGVNTTEGLIAHYPTEKALHPIGILKGLHNVTHHLGTRFHPATQQAFVYRLLFYHIETGENKTYPGLYLNGQHYLPDILGFKLEDVVDARKNFMAVNLKLASGAWYLLGKYGVP